MCSHRHKEGGFETCSLDLRDSGVAMYSNSLPSVVTNCNMLVHSLQGRGVEYQLVFEKSFTSEVIAWQ